MITNFWNLKTYSNIIILPSILLYWGVSLHLKIMSPEPERLYLFYSHTTSKIKNIARDSKKNSICFRCWVRSFPFIFPKNLNSQSLILYFSITCLINPLLWLYSLVLRLFLFKMVFFYFTFSFLAHKQPFKISRFYNFQLPFIEVNNFIFFL